MDNRSTAVAAAKKAAAIAFCLCWPALPILF